MMPFTYSDETLFDVTDAEAVPPHWMAARTGSSGNGQDFTVWVTSPKAALEGMPDLPKPVHLVVITGGRFDGEATAPSHVVVPAFTGSSCDATQCLTALQPVFEALVPMVDLKAAWPESRLDTERRQAAEARALEPGDVPTGRWRAIELLYASEFRDAWIEMTALLNAEQAATPRAARPPTAATKPRHHR
jgi:hypothetical protein